MAHHRYPSDLTDAEWAVLKPLPPPPARDGRRYKWPRHRVLDGAFYVLRTGCAWAQLPLDFPPWQTVYGQQRKWRLSGDWERMHAVLHEQTRRRGGRDSTTRRHRRPPAARAARTLGHAEARVGERGPR